LIFILINHIFACDYYLKMKRVVVELALVTQRCGKHIGGCECCQQTASYSSTSTSCRSTTGGALEGVFLLFLTNFYFFLYILLVSR
jgi:hypothetical protein